MLNQLADYQYQVDEALVLHFMGYNPKDTVSPPILEVVQSQLPLVGQFDDQWGASIELPIQEVAEQQVILNGQQVPSANDNIVLRSSQLPRVLQRCDAVVILLVTAGPTITETTRAASDPLEAFVLDALGSAMTVALMKALTRQVFTTAQCRGYGTTLRMGPGYTGWHIDDQATLLGCFDKDTMPVQFADGTMMKPEKTLLGLTGLRPEGKEAPEIEPCRVCDLPNCRMRLFEFRGIPG
jgi:hypothetical protein